MASKNQTQTAAPRAQAAPAATPAAEPQNAGSLVGRNTGLIARVAARFGIDSDKMLDTLKQTAFRQRGKNGAPAVAVTNEQMLMLLVVAEEHHLNPFCREVYAFPQDGGITPIVGYDGWIRMMNEHPQHSYIEDHYAPIDTPQDDWYHEVEIGRKDRAKPIIVRKYLKEYYRDTDPWNNMPRHMIEIKTTIQCIRKAYGFAGVYDPDEEERIFAAAKDVTPRNLKPETRAPQARRPEPPIDIDPAPAGAATGADQKPPVSEKPPVVAVTIDQATVIADKLKEESVALNRFLAEWEIGAIEELPAAHFDEALRSIDELAAAQ